MALKDSPHPWKNQRLAQGNAEFPYATKREQENHHLQDAKGIGIMIVARKLVFKDMRSYKFMDFIIIFRLELLDTPGAKLKLQYSKSWKCKLCREENSKLLPHLHHPHLFWAPGLVFSSSNVSTFPTIMAWLQIRNFWDKQLILLGAKKIMIMFNTPPENWPSKNERIIF